MRTHDIGFRRAHQRFEVLGTMAGSVISTEALRVVNIGASGALVEAELPLPLNAEYRMQLVVASTVIDATVKVRRVTEERRHTEPVRYLIGLEFLEISDDAQDAIGRLVMLAQPDPNAELGAG
jgi:hypothetical protein